MIAKTDEKGRSGNKIVRRSAEWSTKREESKKRISVPSPFLPSPFLLSILLFARPLLYKILREYEVVT